MFRKLSPYLLVSVLAVAMVNCSPKISKKETDDKLVKKEATTPNASDLPKTAPSTTPSNRVDNSPMTSSGAKKLNDMTVDEQIAMVSQATDNRVQMGRQLFESKCGKCHELYAPGTRSKESWIGVMKKMAPKAGLNDPEHTMVAAYLVKNSK